MNRTGSFSVFLLVAAFIFTVAPAALAQEEGEEATTTTVAPTNELNPAVVVDQTTPEPTTPDWTYRYMIPATIVLAVLVVVVTSVKYFTDVVRKRYRIVRE